METTIIPKYVERKTAKTGNQYFVVEDVNGNKFSVWDTMLGKEFENNFGKPMQCEVKEKNGFNTITTIYEVGKVSNVPQYIPQPKKFEAESKAKTASMLTAYAKDLVIAWTTKDNTQEQAKAITEQAVECMILAYNNILEKL